MNICTLQLCDNYDDEHAWMYVWMYVCMYVCAICMWSSASRGPPSIRRHANCRNYRTMSDLNKLEVVCFQHTGLKDSHYIYCTGITSRIMQVDRSLVNRWSWLHAVFVRGRRSVATQVEWFGRGLDLVAGTWVGLIGWGLWGRWIDQNPVVRDLFAPVCFCTLPYTCHRITCESRNISKIRPTTYHEIFRVFRGHRL